MKRALAYYFTKVYPNLSYAEAYFQAEQLEQNLVMKYGRYGMLDQKEFWNVYVAIKDQLECGKNGIITNKKTSVYDLTNLSAVDPNNRMCLEI